MSLAGIPYLPTIGDHIGDTLVHLAPQAAAQLVHKVWEAYNNSLRTITTNRVIRDPKMRMLEHLIDALTAREEARGFSRPRQGTEAPQAWGSLGDLNFSILTAPTSMDITDGVVFSKQAIIGGKPRLQFTGHELQEIRLPIHWHYMINGDIEGNLKTILDFMRNREILGLVRGDEAGSGIYAGQFVIQRISRQEVRYLANRKIADIDLTLELLEWVPDPDLVLGPAAPAVRRPTLSPAVSSSTWTDDKGIIHDTGPK